MEAILGLAIGGLVVGALARLALPGPDPLPIWATIVLGVVGSFLGGGVGYGVGGTAAALLGSVIAAALVLFAYRRFVQKRPITGPRARLRPGRRRQSGSEESV